MVTFTLSCTFLDPFTREKRSLFLKRRVELIIDFRSLTWHQETVLALLWGRKITFQEQRMNGMLMKNIVVVKDLSASILKC